MAARAESIRQHPKWQRDPFGPDAGAWRDALRTHRRKFGFGLAAALLLCGWLARDTHWITAEHGFGYALGIVSMCCMLILLLYPLRKRYKWLKFIGPLPKWFRNHMVLGISAPILALYHCNFQLGSLNSRIALFSALTVATSGFIGRFIYSKVHHGLYGRKATLKELLARVKTESPDVGRMASFIPVLNMRLTQFDRQVLVPPESIFDCLKLPFVLTLKTRLQYRRLARLTRVTLTFHASQSGIVAAHRDSLERVILQYIRNHLRQVRRVAEFTAYDRLLSLWHKLHFPFFVLLFVSLVAHVAVVHLY